MAFIRMHVEPTFSSLALACHEKEHVMFSDLQERKSYLDCLEHSTRQILITFCTAFEVTQHP
jgi:hypothetical protein